MTVVEPGHFDMCQEWLTKHIFKQTIQKMLPQTCHPKVPLLFFLEAAGVGTKTHWSGADFGHLLFHIRSGQAFLQGKDFFCWSHDVTRILLIIPFPWRVRPTVVTVVTSLTSDPRK